MAVSAAVGRLLRACVRGEATDPIDRPPSGRRADYTGLGDAAWFHGVAGYAHARLRDADWVPAAELTALEELRYGAVRGHLQALASLQRLGAVLDPAGVDWLVVKGPALAEPVHGSPALRAYSDLDVVVPAQQVERALGLLVGDGGKPLVRSWTALHREMSGEFQVRLAGGVVADVHWHLLNHASLRQAFRVPMPEVLASRRTVRLGGVATCTLDDVDTLLHLCLHTMLAGANRLVWLKDIERVVTRLRPDWDAVGARAEQWCASLVVATALDLARKVIDAPVSGEVIDGLAAARGWRDVVAGATRLAPVERASPGGSFGRLVCRATRTGSGDSCRELSRRSAAFLRDGAVSLRDPRGARSRLDPPVGDEPAARRAFFDAVVTSPEG